jgi:DNA polymerase-3 subunit epsilon
MSTAADLALQPADRAVIGVQASFDELGTPLREVTFVVVDLETTGGSHLENAITEIGAVKVRGGEVLGEFQTLVNPGAAIPAFISVLTGITDGMVASAPRIQSALPAFLEFAQGAVLVAHNAPFDVGFLKAAAERCGEPWPGFGVLDTARLARRVLQRDEAPDCKLSTLARLFRATTTPNHRALSDARATVDVLHGLVERVGTEGVQSLEELTTYSSRVPPAVRRKRHLAESLPRSAGVYLFEDAHGRVLYVGKSRDLRARVRSYFTASESRRRMAEMVKIAERVRHVPCPTAVEAEVRELRLIAQHKPRYNRRSRFPERALWLKLTVEAFPRLSVVREVRDDAASYLGPFGSRRVAEAAMTALHEAFRLRQCTDRLSPRRLRSACALFGMGRCGAPCEGQEDVDAYAKHAEAVRSSIERDCSTLVETLERRITRLSDRQRFEEAASHRDRVSAFVRSAARMQRLAALTSLPQVVAARRASNGWEIVVVRHGRLAASGTSQGTVDPRPVAGALVAAAETVRPGPGPTPAASAEETECVLRWLEQPGVRLVQVDGDWTCPVGGAGAHAGRYATAMDASLNVGRPSEDRRALRPVG